MHGAFGPLVFALNTMSKPPHLFRDASNRLTHDRGDIDSHDFPVVCRKVIDHFGLKPTSELIVGPDQMFWDFSDGASSVELAWDNWMCFMVTAKAPNAEPIVQRIAVFLSGTFPPKGEPASRDDQQ